MAVAWVVCLPLAGAIDFEGSKWIWSAGPDQAKAEIRYFRAELDIPESPALESAELVLTADNLFVVHVNGRAIGESKADHQAWSSPQRYDLSPVVAPGRVVVAVEAVNSLPGPAGLLLKLEARLADGSVRALVSGEDWKVSATAPHNWQQPDFDDEAWAAAKVIGPYGAAPWQKPAVPAKAMAPAQPIGKVHEFAASIFSHREPRRAASGVHQTPIGTDFISPGPIAFLSGDCSLYRPLVKGGNAADSLSVTIFNPRKSRAFPEHDLPAPMKVGRKLCVLDAPGPGVRPRVILDAGEGAIGSPGASFDGKSLLVSMVRSGESFFHIYRVPVDGGEPVQLTDGPFHDIDPAELPDGRIVFTSTRIGFFEEYHNTPSRALFTMTAEGGEIRPLTQTIVFDNEPEVLADGRILFIRSDNFFDRGKVETRLHAINPDGTGGVTEFGLDQGPEYGNRLRAYLCGSPAPMPDGRLAFVSGPGITIGSPGDPGASLQHLTVAAGDVAATADGRLLCTTSRPVEVEVTRGGRMQKVRDLQYETICVFDPDQSPLQLTVIHDSPGEALHSPISLAPRPRPPALARKVDPAAEEDPAATGYLFCQDARFTKNTTAGWSHVRAIRVIAGKGLTQRSSHSYIVHAGSEAVELGTVPLAADGSFHLEVPANTPLALQAVDAEGRSELNEMSWIYVKPGERRSCVGCHADRQEAPPMPARMPMALASPPLKLLGQGELHRFRGNNAAVTGLMNMQFDRFREVAGLNRFGMAGDPKAGSRDDLSVLLERLTDADSAERMAAAQRIAVFREAQAAPHLAPLLSDPSREVRVAAAMALAVCGGRDSVSPLLKALDDPDLLVVQAAAVALENLTGHREPLDDLLNPVARRAHAGAWRQWFGSTTWPAIEAELVAKLSDSSRDVVRRAAVSLGHIGGEAARDGLRAYLEQARHHNPLPEWRKKHSGDRARFNALSEVNPRTLQAATRALGTLQDEKALPLLAQILAQHRDPKTANLFLAEAAAEAVGRIGSEEARRILITEFAQLAAYHTHSLWYGDHPALMSCHAAPVHFFMLEALDRLGSTDADSILPAAIRSVPIDPDRGLFAYNDDYETLVGRLIRRHGAEAEVVETCLAVLGDQKADPSERMAGALGKVERCWAGHPDVRNRAAQILSLACRDRGYEPRVRAAFEAAMASDCDIPRVFDTGIPIVDKLPDRHWVAFYLARTLGHLGDPASVPALVRALTEMPAEAAGGRPDPLGPGVLFLENDLTPNWRAASAWALGRSAGHEVTPSLLRVIGDLDNSLDTRFAATEALHRLARPTDGPALRKLAGDYPTVSIRRELLRVIDALRPE